MKKTVELSKLTQNYWGYHVEADPKTGGFIVQNRYNSSLPQGLTLCLPAKMDIAMDGDYLDPARFIPDRYDVLADQLDLVDGFGGVSTSLMFCNFEQNMESGDKRITPTDPLDATHVMVRVAWNLTKDVHMQGTRSACVENCEVKVVYEWHDTDINLMRGWDLLIIELDERLSQEYRQDISYNLDDIAHRHDIAAQIFEQEKNQYRAKYQELEARARAVSWKMNFGDEDADDMELSYKDSQGIHSMKYRYCKSHLDSFLAALIEQEAWEARVTSPREA